MAHARRSPHLLFLAATLAIAVAAPASENARALTEAGRRDEAEQAARAQLADAEARFGAESVEVATAIDRLVSVLVAQDRSADPETLQLAEHALAIRETLLGPDHPGTAESCMVVASTRLRLNRYDGVRELLERALAARRVTFGEDHQKTADVRNNLALALGAQGEFDAAEGMLRENLRLAEARHGRDAAETLASWMNLGSLYNRSGEIRLARSAFERALAIAEANDADAGTLARQLHNLALVIKGSGDLAEARRLNERALALMEQAVGPNHRSLAQTLFQFGNLLLDQAEFNEARAAFARAAVIDPEHPYYPIGLGEARWALGDLSGAERDLRRGLNLLQDKGWDHADAYAHGQLGRVLLEQGRRDEGKRHLRRAVELDPDLNLSVGALASLRLDAGDLDGARALYRQTLTSRESRWGSDHPDVAESRVDIARVDLAAGRASEARTALARALPIQDRVFGETHPIPAETRIELARAHLRLDQPAQALELALAGERVVREHVRLTSSVLPERLALRQATARRSGIDLALSVALRTGTPADVAKAWDAVIRGRAMVLDEMASRNGGARRDAELERALAASRARLAHVLLRGPEGNAERFRTILETVQADKERAEQALAERSARFRATLEERQAGWDRTAGAVPAGAALIAYVRYEHESTDSAPSREDYAAFVMPGGASPPRLVGLGPAEQIDRRIDAWRREASVRPPAARPARRRTALKLREAGLALRHAIWDPAAKLLGGGTTLVLVVPDSALHLVGFPALPSDDGGFLVESAPTIHLLSAERDLIRPVAKRGHGLLALGAVDFAGTEAADGPSADGSYRRTASTCEEFRSLRYPPLPSSGDELERVARVWRDAGTSAEPVTTLTGARADEPSLRARASGTRVVHLATHGFFLGSGCRSALAETATTGPEASLAVGDNPLLLSGVALAGFNRRQQAGSGETDGVLTAEEVASLDLDGVEWVVLSACGTALGDIRTREGVLGLQRAFRVAGARTLIMTLWPVRDRAAAAWMETLYRERAEGRSTAEAVRGATLQAIAAAREAGREPHPFDWGGFIAAGDWR